MSHETIIARFLSPRLSAFVQAAEREWNEYATNPRSEAKPGCLKRDRVRYLLTSRAYARYSATL